MNKFAKYVPEEAKKLQREFIGAAAVGEGGSAGTVVEKTLTVEPGYHYIKECTMFDETFHFLPIYMGETDSNFIVNRKFALIEGETYTFTDMNGVEYTSQAVKNGNVLEVCDENYIFTFYDLGMYFTAIIYTGSVSRGPNTAPYSLRGKFLQTEVSDEPLHTVSVEFSEDGIESFRVNGMYFNGFMISMLFPTILYAMATIRFSADWDTLSGNVKHSVLLLNICVDEYDNILNDITADVFGYVTRQNSPHVKTFSLMGKEVDDSGGEGPK